MADNRATRGRYGQTKVSASYLLTPAAKEMVKEIASHLDVTNSEALERAIRLTYDTGFWDEKLRGERFGDTDDYWK